MSTLRIPTSFPAGLLARTTTKRTPLQNGRAAASSVVAPMELAIAYLAGHPGRVCLPGVHLALVLTTSYQYVRLRVAKPVLADILEVRCRISGTYADTTALLTVTTDRDGTGASMDPSPWVAPVTVGAPFPTTCRVQWAGGPSATAPGTETIVVGAKLSAAGSGVVTWHSVALAACPLYSVTV